MSEQIRFSHIDYYPNGRSILDDVSFTVSKGEFILIRGLSGSGKSSLLRLMVLLEKPQSGQIYLEGQNYRKIPPSDLRQKISYIHQLPQLIEASVRENILLPYRFKTHKGKELPTDEHIDTYLKKFNLKIDLSAMALSCSIGEQQRICFIRNLLLKPEVLLLDEPTSALDKINRDILLKTIENFENTTIFMVDHSGYEPLNRFYKILEIKDSKVSIIS